MKEIERLIETVDYLLGPQGCPWDREQTLKSVRQCIIEEAAELVEAIDLEDNDHIKEELGDYFFHAIFLSRLGEKENRLTMKEVLEGIIEKLISRHPHIFADVKLESPEEVVHQWERIKKQEKKDRKSAMDGIPKNLPALAKAWKMLRAMKKAGSTLEIQGLPVGYDDEEGLGELLFQLTIDAEAKGIDAEHALRLVLSKKEKAFREEEDILP